MLLSMNKISSSSSSTFNRLVVGASKSTALLYNFLLGETTISYAIKFGVFSSLLIVALSPDRATRKR